MFWKKIDDLFSSMPNSFNIVDDILIAGLDEQGKDHDKTLDKVVQISRQANLKLNKDKCLFRCSSFPFFGKVTSWQSVSLDTSKVLALTEMPPPKCKKELQSFMGILKYLSK